MKTFLTVLLIIVVVCFLIGCIRVGGIVEYSEEGVVARVRIGLLKIKVFPMKKKKKKKDADKQKDKKKKKPKKKKKAKSTGDSSKTGEKKEAPRKKGGPIQLVKTWLPLGLEALGKVKRNICIDELTVDYTINGKGDPANAAILYGRICAGGGWVTALLENNFTVKKRNISAYIDFLADQALIYLKLSLSFTIGQLVVMALSLGWMALKIWLGSRSNKQEVTKDGKQASDQ